MSYKELGRKLQKAREEANLSQDDLARMLGCTQSSLSNYELGKRRLYLSDLKRIADLLGKSVEFFLEWENTGASAHSDNIDNILQESYIKEILFAARDLPLSKRKSVLDYILWQKSEGANK